MRVTEKEPNEYPWWLKIFFWKQKRKYGAVLKPSLIWGRIPKLFAGVGLLYGTIDRKHSPIVPSHRALLTLRVSQINHCQFCVDINTSLLLKRTGSMEKAELLANWRENEFFNSQEKAMLDYAEAITYTDRNVTDKMVERLREYFDDDGIVELTALIAFQNLSSKFNSALDIPPQGFCQSLGGKHQNKFTNKD